jgi:hydroxylamine reductase (hybrid-cluster protein)
MLASTLLDPTLVKCYVVRCDHSRPLHKQKAPRSVLTLLSLGVKNIRLGPSLPAFVTPAVLNVRVDKCAIKPITTVEADMKAALAGN